MQVCTTQPQYTAPNHSTQDCTEAAEHTTTQAQHTRHTQTTQDSGKAAAAQRGCTVPKWRTWCAHARQKHSNTKKQWQGGRTEVALVLEVDGQVEEIVSPYVLAVHQVQQVALLPPPRPPLPAEVEHAALHLGLILVAPGQILGCTRSNPQCTLLTVPHNTASKTHSPTHPHVASMIDPPLFTLLPAYFPACLPACLHSSCANPGVHQPSLTGPLVPSL